MEEEVAIKLPFSLFRLWDIRTCLPFFKKRAAKEKLFIMKSIWKLKTYSHYALVYHLFGKLEKLNSCKNQRGEVRYSMAVLI